MPTHIENLLMLWRLPFNIQQMSFLKKEFHPNSNNSPNSNFLLYAMQVLPQLHAEHSSSLS